MGEEVAGWGGHPLVGAMAWQVGGWVETPRGGGKTGLAGERVGVGHLVGGD